MNAAIENGFLGLDSDRTISLRRGMVLRIYRATALSRLRMGNYQVRAPSTRRKPPVDGVFSADVRRSSGGFLRPINAQRSSIRPKYGAKQRAPPATSTAWLLASSGAGERDGIAGGSSVGEPCPSRGPRPRDVSLMRGSPIRR
jgi:hypothetical protein